MPSEAVQGCGSTDRPQTTASVGGKLDGEPVTEQGSAYVHRFGLIASIYLIASFYTCRKLHCSRISRDQSVRGASVQGISWRDSAVEEEKPRKKGVCKVTVCDNALGPSLGRCARARKRGEVGSRSVCFDVYVSLLGKRPKRHRANVRMRMRMRTTWVAIFSLGSLGRFCHVSHK